MSNAKSDPVRLWSRSVDQSNARGFCVKEETNMITRHRVGTQFKAQDRADGRWIIEGYASTDAVDSYNEIVEPEAFRETMAQFEEFPVVLFMHRFYDMPVGKVISWEIRTRGLWVEVEISKTADKIWDLIQDDYLKAFSIGFNYGTVESTDGDGPDIIKKLILLEISVVNIPANRESLFNVANEKGIDLSEFNTKSHKQTLLTKGGGGMDTLTLDQVKTVTDEAVKQGIKDALPTLTTVSKDAARDAVKTAIGNIEVKPPEGMATLAQIQEATKNAVTQADLEGIKDAVLGDLSALQKKLDRIAAPGLSPLEGSLANIPASRLRILGDDLGLLATAYDKVILDLGAGVERTVRQFTHKVGTCLVITTDEPTALTDAYAFIKVIHTEQSKANIQIIINIANSVHEGNRTYQTLLKACEGFLKISPPLLGVVRRDLKVREAIRNQSSILTRFPNSEAAVDVEAIIGTLLK